MGPAVGTPEGDRSARLRLIVVEIASAIGEGPATVQLRAAPEALDEEKALERTLELRRGSAEVHLALASGERWRIQAAAPGYWSSPSLVEVEVDAVSTPVERLTLWPAAELAGKLELPDLRDRPDQMQVRLSPVPGIGGDPGAQPAGPLDLTCRVVEQQVTPCTLPAGRWNLRLTVAPFAPHFLWEKKVEARQSLDVGTLELQRGGSILGRMRTELGAVDPKRARVWLRPLAGAEPDDPELREQLRQLTRFGEIRADGDFQFLGVPPGNYELQASHPGFVTATRAPVTVERGAWTELDEPVVLELPVRLSLSIEPIAEPSGESWRLELYRVGKHGDVSVAAEGETDALGFWESPPLPAGPYSLRILDAEENAVLRQDLELARGSGLTRIQIPLVYVEGQVSLGARPLESVLWFGGRTGEERVEARSDEAGEFFVVLPRDGTWRVDVQAESPPVLSRGLRVDIEPLEGLELAEARIEVPDTALMGQVVDELGAPPKTLARVALLRLDGESGFTSTETAATGHFELYGMPPGAYNVSAETADASATPVTIDVGEDVETSVRLVLHPESQLTGTVISDSGPVPGASVLVYFLARTGAGGRMIEERRTTPSGRFEVPVPADAVAVRFLVMAPGYTLDVTRVSEAKHVEIVLERIAGTIRLEAIEDAVSIREDSTVGLLMIDGEAVDLPRIVAWARLHDAKLTEDGALSVPSMPPGQYALCRLTIQEAVLVMDGAALPSAQACTEGYLTPGGELRLIAPS
jgi:hypothetical protein